MTNQIVVSRSIPTPARWQPGESNGAPSQVAVARTHILMHPPAYLRHIVTLSHQWFDLANEKDFSDHVDGALIAAARGLTKQIGPYRQQLIDILDRDGLARAAAVVSAHTGYQGTVYHHPTALPRRAFVVPMAGAIRSPSTRTYIGDHWYYAPIEQFRDLIPPHAMKAMALLACESIRPDRFWVAEWRRVLQTTQILDPLLCASFGRWLVALAEWA